MIWVRVGDGAEYESFEDLELVARHMVDAGVTEPVTPYNSMGVQSGEFHGKNYISLFKGDENAQPYRWGAALDQEDLDYLNECIRDFRDIRKASR